MFTRKLMLLVHTLHPQRAPKSMFSCRSIFLKMEQDRPTREHGFGCPLGMHAEKHIFFVRHLLVHVVFEKGPYEKYMFFARHLLVHVVFEKGPYEKYMFFRKYIRSKKHMFLKKYRVGQKSVYIRWT